MNDFCDCLFFEMRYFSIFFDFLCDESCKFSSVDISVVHDTVHIDFITISTYTAAECRVHPSKCVKVACADEDEVA